MRKESHKLLMSASALSTHNAKGEEEIPIKRIKVWLGTIPQRILPSIVLRVDHGPVNSAVETGQERRVDPLLRYPDGRHLFRPQIHSCGMRSHEVESRDLIDGVHACLIAADKADSHTGEDGLVRGAMKSDKGAALYKLARANRTEEGG